MNKGKLIFLVMGLILLAIIAYVVSGITPGTKTVATKKKPSGTFTIWTFGDDKNKFQNFINDFKTSYPQYSTMTITVESFSDYEDYFYTLASALNKGLGPDIFILNNNEKSILQEQILGIDPSIVSPNDFRKNYRGVFSDDLIERSTDGKMEYLIGIPIGYEALGLFYNRKFFNSKDLTTWSGLNNAIYDLKEKQNGVTPIGIGNGSTVNLSNDILTQLFVLDGVKGINSLSSNNIVQALSTYKFYGEEESNNSYNSTLPASSKENNIDLFSAGEIAAIIGYPRTLEEIDKKGYSDKYLLATPFPKYAGGSSNKTFINYNYFAVSRDTTNIELGLDMMQFMSTRTGAASYLNTFPYYIPAMTVLENEVMEQKIDDSYNIVYKDFYDRETELASFDKGIKTIYDSEVEKLLDTKENTEDLFEDFRRKLLCKTNKALNLINISTGCN